MLFTGTTWCRFAASLGDPVMKGLIAEIKGIGMVSLAKRISDDYEEFLKKSKQTDGAATFSFSFRLIGPQTVHLLRGFAKLIKYLFDQCTSQADKVLRPPFLVSPAFFIFFILNLIHRYGCNRIMNICTNVIHPYPISNP
jgi:hypothetical protein